MSDIADIFDYRLRADTLLEYNKIMLQLIKKAIASNMELASLANMPLVMKSLIQLWLTTPDVGIAEDAADTILALLHADQERQSVTVHDIEAAGRSQGGQGLIWRRLFEDRDVYSCFFEACSSNTGRKERSLAQARLMSVAPKIGAMDWSYLSKSHLPDIESQYGLNPTHEGLLDFIAVHMVHYKDDVLIHISLIQFFKELLSSVKQPSSEK